MTSRANYDENLSPLKAEPLIELPLGSIQPRGWIRDQLEIQASGLTGQLMDSWADVGPNSGWLGGTGESWERGPYYLDGLLPLAYLLQSETLLAKVKPWIEWTLSSQREDGWFGPDGNDDWWCRAIMLKVLIQHADATGDERIVPFLSKYFAYQLRHLPHRPLTEWAQARGEEHLLPIQWLYNRTRDDSLLELASLIHQQSVEWADIFADFPFWRYVSQWNHRTHVVNVAMGIKYPALYSLFSKNDNDFNCSAVGIEKLMTYHGQVHGMFSGDEWLAGTHPSQGVELCAVVEYMFTLENLVRISGDGIYADILEKVAFNALPATISPDWHGHQYDQQANQIECSLAKRNWTQNGDDSNLFGLEPNFGCCTANMHQGWPKFAARLWMATPDAGLAAISYAPCHVRGLVGDGVTVQLDVDTDYPFDHHITIKVHLPQTTTFPIKLRIPGWCRTPDVQVNGERYPVESCQGFADIVRPWSDGDTIQITLPMNVQLETRGNRAVGVQRGPLVYVLPIQERWQRLRGKEPFPDWEVYPESPWNYGLSVDMNHPDSSFRVVQSAVERQPFIADCAPVRLTGRGRRVPEWRKDMNSAGTLPVSPVATDEPEEELTLVPYGSARLRIGEFPVVRSR